MFGPRIAALRRSRGWSQSELAEILNISPSAVGMYEQGRREPAAAILVALGEVFEVSTDYLLTGKVQTEEEARKQEAALKLLYDSARARLERRKDKPFSPETLQALLEAQV